MLVDLKVDPGEFQERLTAIKDWVARLNDNQRLALIQGKTRGWSPYKLQPEVGPHTRYLQPERLVLIQGTTRGWSS